MGPQMRISLIISVMLTTASGLSAEAVSELIIAPKTFTLRGRASQQRLLVTWSENGQSREVTSRSTFRAEPANLVHISDKGVVTPLKSGRAKIVATIGEKQTVATVEIIDGERDLPATFERDVIPVLTKLGCNAGACHGKSGGQNGFQLSLLGFDPNFDYDAILHESRGRRVFPAAPDRSLLLLKASAQIPHGGGRRLQQDDRYYRMLLRWLKNGSPRDPENVSKVTHITISPVERILKPRGKQQLLVTAHYTDGTAADVTHLSTFQSNESAIAGVNDDGLITAGPLPGEAAIMARFMEKFAICNVLIPLPSPAPNAIYEKLPRNNFIDDHIHAKLKQLGIAPSELCDDATFLRRAFLDVIGRAPTPTEAREFLKSEDGNKRETLIDQLLKRPEYAEFQANKWADLLRPNPYRVGMKAVYNLDAWLRQAFRKNQPYDQFVHELLTAKGSTFRNGAVTVFRDRRDPTEIATMVSQLFLGIRLECAKCHHHPFEVWGQEDFYSLAAYFARIGRKGRGISPPISGSEEIIYTGTKGDVKHPLTDEILEPRPLFGKAPEIKPEDDRRDALAKWIVSDENPYFARVMVNRVWADLMGRGIVEPIDDLRATNPPSNGPLLDALAEHFRKSNYDLKKLMRTIMLSRAYQLSSLPNKYNVGDTRNYSRHYRQRLRAEVLLDMVSDMTGVPESFSAMPPGSRAMELWTVRSQSIFLDSFGRPDPNQDPPCERTTESTVVQALHLMNAPKLHSKVISDKSRMAELAKSKKPVGEVIDELYLLVYGRFPEQKERAICEKVFKKNERRKAIEDIAWSLINTPEFTLKD